MKAAVVRAFDAPPRYEDFADPALGEGDVEVHVHAAGIHPLVRALANGTHYGSGDSLPFVPGVDGTGRLGDGTRVYFGGARRPFGTMAARAVVPRAMCLPLPAGVDDTVAAAAANPGMSAWLALTWRAKLEPGETVLVLGATGVAGQMAVQLARSLGAGRIIAAGRNERVLAKVADLGADAIVRVDQPPEDLARAFAREAGSAGIHVIVDYLWGRPAEAAITAITRKGLTHAAPRVRHVQVGASSSPTITLPAAVLRSSGLEITGTGAGTVPWSTIFEAVPAVLEKVAAGALRVDVEQAPLAEVEEAWGRPAEGKRIVLVP